MSEPERDSLLREFQAVTGITEEDRARFFLEAAHWDLTMALAGFFEEDGDTDQQAMDDGVAQPMSASSMNTTGGSDPKVPQKTAPRKFGTIGGLSASQGSEEDGKNDGKQAFFAGGGAHGGSGQQVLGPGGKKNNDKIIEDIFKAAKDAGAEEVSPSDRPDPRQNSNFFQGQGFRLGMTSDDHFSVGAPMTAATTQAEDLDVRLFMWRDGFSVDDGPLRPYDDPAHRDFLRAVQRGEIPDELIRQAKGGQVALDMEDRRGEDFVAPKKKFKAFGGGGQRLGSPDVGGSVAPVASKPAQPPAEKALASGESPVVVDESAPITTLQIRLDDGSRVTGKFNHGHSVGDVRSFVVSRRPRLAGLNFALMTTFPNRELSDEAATLVQADLINAVIVVRVKPG